MWIINGKKQYNLETKIIYSNYYKLPYKSNYTTIRNMLFVFNNQQVLT